MARSIVNGIVVDDSDVRVTYPSVPSTYDTIVTTTADRTTTGQSLVDITDLKVNVSAASTYEFEAVLQVVASADTNGMEIGVHTSQTPVTVVAAVTGNTATTTAASVVITAVDTATAAFNTTSGGKGIITVRGVVVTHATLDGTLSLQHLKVTAGTSTVKKGSTLKVRKVA